MSFMGLRLHTLRLIAIFIAGVLAFTQVALAGFACPMAGAPQAMQQAMADGDCPQAPDAGSKVLCEKTCQAEPQKHDVPALDVPPLPPSPGLRVQRIEGLVPVLAALPPPPDHHRPTAPPPHKQYLRYLK